MCRDKEWIERYGGSAEIRERKIRICSGIKTWGLVFIVITLLAMFWFIFFEMPEKPADAFMLSLALAVCLSAGFSLLTSMETEIKLLKLVGHVEAERELQGRTPRQE